MLNSHVIKNDLWMEKCPLCGDAKIVKQGNITYANPTLFSTCVVVLEEQPELWKCLGCGSGFTQNIIREENSKSLYQQGESDGRWVSRRFEKEKTKEVVSSVRSLLKPGCKVLDVGCAGGEFLDFAKENQCITHGLEYSISNARLLESKGHVAYGNIQEADEKYDLITAFDVVEHLYDINEFIDLCLNRLSPMGHLLFVTGDISSFSARVVKYNWWYASYPEHVIFPSPQFFSSHSGLKNVKVVHTYASVIYEPSPLLLLRRIIGSLLKLSFSGQGLFGRDHILVIAQPK
jgi:SAM-dependent methyltransferase